MQEMPEKQPTKMQLTDKALSKIILIKITGNKGRTLL